MSDNSSRLRIIKTSMLKAFWVRHSDAVASLKMWVAVTKAVEWRSFADIRRTFPSADQVTVASGRSVIVFNVARNRYRLIAAVHYKSQIVFTPTILTHKEYGRDKWKENL